MYVDDGVLQAGDDLFRLLDALLVGTDWRSMIFYDCWIEFDTSCWRPVHCTR